MNPRPGIGETLTIVGASVATAAVVLWAARTAGELWVGVVLVWLLLGLGYNLGMLHARYTFARQIESAREPAAPPPAPYVPDVELEKLRRNQRLN